MKKIYTAAELKEVLSQSDEKATDTLNDCFAADGESLNVTVKIAEHSEVSVSIPQVSDADTAEFYAEWEAATPILLAELREKLEAMDA